MLSTYFNGECYDIEEDRISAKMGSSPFSGGSRVMVNNIIAPGYVKAASMTAIVAACFIGLLLQFYYKTGVWTIPLGLTGIIAGVFYSLPPIRWVKRGIGEVLIGYSYGWLPVAVGFYLQAAKFVPIVHWMALPIACTIFNVILINEFPDYAADSIAGKRNLVVRLGKRKAALIYVCAAVVSWTAFFASVQKCFSPLILIPYIPVWILSCTTAVMMLTKRYDEGKALMFLCGSTIMVNLTTTLVYMVGIFFING